MLDYQLSGLSFKESLKVLEADIQHANMLATSIPRAKDGALLQMKFEFNHLAPFFLFLLQWMNCFSACIIPTYFNLFHVVMYKVCPNGKTSISSFGRKTTIREFYAIILPSLQRFHNDQLDLDITEDEIYNMEFSVKNTKEEKRKLSNMDLMREDECGICLEPCTKMVLPNCCHAMCINCYRDWNMRSESCPFCRGSLKRVNSSDLWVLPCNDDLVDTETVLKEDMLRFFLYINSLPKDIPDDLFLMYYEYLI